MKKLFILLSIVATFSVAGYSQNYQNYHFDVNGDGYVTSADVTALYDYLLGNVPIIDGHEYVDLGLPSGTLWATTNIGATNPEDYGDYFAWGETEPKESYDWTTYKWCKGSDYALTKYCTQTNYGYNGFYDGKSELDPEDDAATANWGPNWCMPSLDQIQELIDNCTSVWTTRNGVNGRLFTSNVNGAQLFLPAVGYRWNVGDPDAGTRGYYWTRMLRVNGPANVHVLHIDSSVYISFAGRSRGQCVRPVCVSQK
ncbi:MAG: hypothetical protein IKW83_00190 [Muribaculaceae bacterium]|nr:hypothetical protein [Muribaculaceae bacterium]